METEEFSKLESRIQEFSLNRWKNYVKAEEARVAPAPLDRRVFGHYMSLILVAGRAAKITFKLHFMSEDMVALMSRSLGESPEAITDERVIDFAKEFCNQFAGGIKQKFEGSGGIRLGISLPVATTGFDEVFYPRPKAGPDTLASAWVVTTGLASVTFSIVVELLEIEGQRDAVSQAFEGVDEAGSIEFL